MSDAVLATVITWAGIIAVTAVAWPFSRFLVWLFEKYH